MDKKNETIKLTLPINTAYVSCVRLTASSIANRMGFPIDAIEDIKSAVSEACVFIIGQSKKDFTIHFHLKNQSLQIDLFSEEAMEISNSPLGLQLIKALMDEIQLVKKPKGMIIQMKKKLSN